MKTIILIIGFVVMCAFFGCTDQRDLYIKEEKVIKVVSDWGPSNMPDNNGATVFFFAPETNIKVMLSNIYSEYVQIPSRKYNMLIINGYMFSEGQSHLDNIVYRNTNSFYDFEAVATQKEARMVVGKNENEIVVNNPDSLATRAITEVFVPGGYQRKYANGIKQNISISDLVVDTAKFTPCRVTHNCNVIVHVKNANVLLGKAVKASLRGFSGSVFLASRKPSNTNVTYQFNLSGLKYDKGSTKDGTIRGKFLSFGPPLEQPQRKYELQIYVNGSKKDYIYDVTEQINPQIERIKKDRLNDQAIMKDIDVEVDLDMEEEDGGIDVGVGDWGDDIIIIVPFN